MKGLSLIAQFNFQRAADVAIQKRLSTPESHLGHKKAERRIFFLYSASQVRVFENAARLLKPPPTVNRVIFVVQSFLRIRRNTARISTSVESARVFLKKMFPISRGIQQGFPPPRTDRSGTKVFPSLFLRRINCRQRLAAITANRNSTLAHHDCCCGRE